MKNLFKTKVAWMMAILSIAYLTSCDEVEDAITGEDPVSSFQYVIGDPEWAEVTFTNFSQNAELYAWSFGDTEVSTDKDPIHTYAAAGEYTVTLVATNATGATSTFSETINVTDPLEASRLLFGEWQLLADASTGVNTFQVGPADRSGVWWSYGTAEELCVRECILDDTWNFNEDGTYDYENNGDFWAEAGSFAAEIENTCFDTSVSDNWVGLDGDLSGWDSGTHNYVYDASASTLTVTGGFVGLAKVGSTAEYTTPQASVTYKITKLVDAAVDTLVLETVLTDAGGYWEFVLVKYDDPNDVVVVDECEVVDPGEKVIVTDVSVDFEDGEIWVNNQFGGSVFQVIDNPDTDGNTSTKVGELVHGNETWAGIGGPAGGYIDFTGKTEFSVMVWSPNADAVLKFKMEDSANGDINTEFDVAIGAANSWVKVTVPLSSFTVGAGLQDEIYDTIVLFPGWDTSAADTYYIDDIILE